jgi:hypothetical protein
MDIHHRAVMAKAKNLMEKKNYMKSKTPKEIGSSMMEIEWK